MMTITAGTANATAERQPTRRWLSLAALLLATFMGILDVFIVNVATPSIQRGLGASFGQAQLVIAGYTLAYAVGLVPGGRLGDRYGRKRIFLVGVAAFLATSLACAAASSAAALIAARLVQGGAAALLLPQVLSLIQIMFTGRARATAMGLYGATIGLASIAGQLIGGALLDIDLAGLGWRVVFLVNLPMGLVALAVSARTVPADRPNSVARIDVPGAVLLGLALAAVLVPVTLGPAGGWSVWSVLPIGAAAAVAFVLRQRRAADPLVPPRLVADRRMVRGLLTVLAFYAGNSGLFLLLAYHLQAALRLDPLGSGLVFAPLGVGFALTSIVGRGAVARHGRRALIAGAATMAVALLAVAAVAFLVPDHAQALALLPALFLAGLGQGTIAPHLVGDVLATAAPRDAGAASGILLTSTQIANALGVAVIGAVFAGVLGGAPGQAGVAGYGTATAVTATLLAGLAAGTGLLLRARR